MTADAVGGVWAYALELVDALAVHDIDVALAVLGPRPGSAQRRQLAASAVGSVHGRAYPLEWMPSAAADLPRTRRWLLDIAEEEQPDVVHLNGYVFAAFPFSRPVVSVAHSCVLSWHEAVRGRSAGSEWNWYRHAVSAGIAAASAVVAPTAAMLAEIERLYCPGGKCIVIPNGRSPVSPLPKERFVVGAGRIWDDAKNLAALERIAPSLDCPVLVAGGDLPAADVAELLGRAAVFAAPAHYEPFGLAALEAALAGCALVLGDIPSLREVWGDAALYADSWDDVALLGALRRALREPEPLARAARARAGRYTPAAMAVRYVELYDHLLSERLGGARERPTLVG